MTSIITQERRILRDAYLALDESLEFLNSELNKEQIARSNRLHRQWQDNPDAPLQAIEDELARPPKDAITHPSIRHQMTILLGYLYDLAQIMREVQHQTEEVKDLTLQHLISHHSEVEGEVREQTIDRTRPAESQNHGAGLRPLAGHRAPPDPPLGNLDPGHLQQGTHFARAHPDGQRPRRKRTP